MIRVTCQACRCFKPDVVTPVGEGAAELCWLCAHHVTEHGLSLAHAPTGECECTAEQVYPAGWRAELARKLEAGNAFNWRGAIRGARG